MFAGILVCQANVNLANLVVWKDQLLEYISMLHLLCTALLPDPHADIAKSNLSKFKSENPVV